MKSLFEVIDNPPEIYEYVPPAKVRQLTAEELIRGAHEASKVLRTALTNPDITQGQIRAALGLLDRAGFGPHQSIALDDSASLASFEMATADQLEHRALLISNLAKKFRRVEARTNDDDVHPSEDDEDASSSVH